MEASDGELVPLQRVNSDLGNKAGWLDSIMELKNSSRTGQWWGRKSVGLYVLGIAEAGLLGCYKNKA